MSAERELVSYSRRKDIHKNPLVSFAEDKSLIDNVLIRRVFKERSLMLMYLGRFRKLSDYIII